MAKEKVAAQAKEGFKIGDKVRALRSHNKTIILEGYLTSIDGDDVHIELTAAGVESNLLPVEHETYESVHAADVTLIEKTKAKED